jgi:hypothetical protein
MIFLLPLHWFLNDKFRLGFSFLYHIFQRRASACICEFVVIGIVSLFFEELELIYDGFRIG